MAMPLVIDHVTIAAAQLEPLQQAFAALGLQPTYGGIHSNGVTHMAMLSFADGSYIELISTLQLGQISPWWHAHIAGNGGVCAWAARCSNATSEAARLSRLGIAVRGPVVMQRARPDGRRLEWELVYLGEGEPGSVLPFLIQDHTPRSWRVPPETAVAVDLLTGVVGVVLGVPDLDATASLFQHAYGWPTAVLRDDPAFGARLAHFRGTPVTVAAPATGSSWLAERLAHFGPSPCALLLGTTDFETACARFGVKRPGEWYGQRAGWLATDLLRPTRIALISANAGVPPRRLS